MFVSQLSTQPVVPITLRSTYSQGSISFPTAVIEEAFAGFRFRGPSLPRVDTCLLLINLSCDNRVFVRTRKLLNIGEGYLADLHSCM